MPVNNANIHGPRQAFEGDGSTLVFQYDFDGDLSLVSTIRVHEFDDINGDGVQLTEDVDYTVNESNRTVTFVVAPASGTIIVVSRFTNRDRQIDYQSGSNLPERDLDEDTNRLTAVTQEIEGDLDNCLHLNSAGTGWNAEGLEGMNAGPATQPNSWVTQAQAAAMIAGGQPATSPSALPIVWFGDGVTTDFEITGHRDLRDYQMFVYVEGVIQSLEPQNESYSVVTEDDTGYLGASGGPAYVRFNDPPVDGARIEIRVLSGTVVGIFGDGSIEGDAIADDAIGVQHINVGAGANPRFMAFDAEGDASVRPLVSTDIIDLNPAVATLPVNGFAAATGNLDMGLNKIVNLATGTAALHAVNKSQMEGYVDSRLRAQQATIHSLMPTAVSGTFTDLATFAFTPDKVTISASYDGGTHDATYTVLFFGANARRVAGEVYADGSRAPDAIFQRNSETLQMRLVAVNSLTGWSQGRALAEKFGDA